MAKVTGVEEIEGASGASAHGVAASIQEKLAFLPDYGFKASGAEEGEAEEGAAWPAVDSGTTVSGLVGGGLTLLVAVGIGLVLKRRAARAVTQT